MITPLRMNMKKLPSLRLFLASSFLLMVLQLLWWRNYWLDITNPFNVIHAQKEVYDNITLNFDDFNNETGTNDFIVPNIIHFIRFNKTEFSFVDYICIRAAYVHHRPHAIYFHTDVEAFSGKYWSKIKSESSLYAIIRILNLQVPSEIFGQKVSEGWRYFHGSDIARIQTLMKYGGIYLDNDVYVVQNLDKYRHFEMALGWDDGQFLGNQVIIANRNARFLPLWLETYRQYFADKWYYNAGERPTETILYQHPELIHRVRYKFGVHMLIHDLFDNIWNEWKEQDTIHLLINHRSYLDPHFKHYPVFNEDNIRDYNYTFGYMAREIWF